MNIEKIRVSIGSASVLGLVSTKYEVAPTTCYIMTYISGKCSANCGFCPQARSSNSSLEMLSRINWPTFDFKTFITKLKYISPLKKFKRICVQTLNYKNNFEDLYEIISEIKKVSDLPISIAIPPMDKLKMEKLKEKGVERVGIALDGAIPDIFEKVKGQEVNGPYRWETHINALKEALDIFKKGFVSTHLIVGLGETQKGIFEILENLHSMGILPGLFAFTPLKGIKLEKLNKPEILDFRKVQLGRYLVIQKNKNTSEFVFNAKGNLINFNIHKSELKSIVEETDAFLTSGCPNCNRPYYDSNPSGNIYNFPRKLNEQEKREILNQLLKFVN